MRPNLIISLSWLLSLPIIIGVLPLIAVGGGNASGIRLLVLSLLGIYPTLKFIQNKHIHQHKTAQLFFIIAIVWWLIFCIHSLVISVSWLVFGGSIDSFFIVQAIANTTSTETLEFLSFHWVNLCLMIMALLVVITGYFLGLVKYFNIQDFIIFKSSKIYKILLGIFILLCVLAYAIKPSRNNSPFVFWVKYAEKIANFKAENAKHKEFQQNWLNFANQQVVSTKTNQSQTHILVISESLTSKNMNVCGYPRNTTPFITQYQNELSIFCQAYSRYSTTINSIKSVLTDIESDPETVPTQSLLGFAKSAGFKTFWISNQDDAYLSSLFGDFADEKIYHNKLGGRSSFSIDEEILPYLDKALQDNSNKKLIVMHLIGSHPNYSARYPQKFAIFPSDTVGFDKISAEFDKNDIGMITKQHRDTYDNSVTYQDFIFNEIFHKIKQNSSEIRSMTFLSDHGNEVGHEKDYAGHSNTTEAGFLVPVILWDNQHQAKGLQTKKYWILVC